MGTNIAQLKEYARIIKDTPYALKTYLQTFDNTQGGNVPLELFPDQESLLSDYDTYNENITRKYRQAGVSTVTAAWVSKILQIASKDKPEKVLIVANKRDTAIEMANKIRGFLMQWPYWMNVGFSPDKNSESRFRLKNDCEVKAVATSKDALRGYTPTILIFDEAAYIEAGDDFWAASMASLSTGGKIILISTPNGFDPIYYTVFDQALKGINNFHISDLAWYKDPRYAKNLQWIKVKDMVHYMLNRGVYDDMEKGFILRDVPQKDYKQTLEDGYKPYSPWFESMAKKLKFDPRKIAQEIECDFLGSGDSVIPYETRENIVKNMLREPKEKMMSGDMWYWKEPIEGHRYIMGIDVSRGDSEDFSSICVLDFDDREQVLEYVGKIPPDDLAQVAYRWAVLFKAYVVIDITGGMGIATARKFQEMGYRDMFIDGINTQNIWEYSSKMMDKIPGINFNNKRTQIVASFEEQLRHGFIVRSQRMVNEMGTFVYLNGRPDHMKGTHDDAIMACAIALYVGDICFSQLQKAGAVNKAMMESWVLSEREYDPQQSFYSYGKAFDPLGTMTLDGRPVDDNPLFQNDTVQSAKQQYKNYSWLFGNPYKHR